MASPTKKLKVRRLLKKASKGKVRKRLDRNLGSTKVRLPLDQPNANELAQKKAASPK